MVRRVHKYADGGKVVDPWTSAPEHRSNYRNRTVLEKQADGTVTKVRKKVPPQSPAAEAYSRVTNKTPKK